MGIHLSRRYNLSLVKAYDGGLEGSSSLWAVRMSKAYGNLSEQGDHNTNIEQFPPFNYSERQVNVAKQVRTSFYKRLINPEDIIKALHFSPVVVDLEIFDSIFFDNGIISLPDEEDTKEELSHCVTIVNFNYQNNFFEINIGWHEWGENGFGLLPFEYLEKYLITAFAEDILIRSKHFQRREFFRKKYKVGPRKCSIFIFSGHGFLSDSRKIYNIELFSSGGDLIGWAHCAIDNKKTLEILDLFIKMEFRRCGYGSFLIEKMIDYYSPNNITGYIDGFDLIHDREEAVKNFLLKNNLIPIPDRSQFKTAKFRIAQL